MHRVKHTLNQPKCALHHIETLWKARNTVINFFDDSFSVVSETIYKTMHAEVTKILTTKQMLQKLPLALAQVKAGNTSKNLLNETRQIIYFCIKQTK